MLVELGQHLIVTIIQLKLEDLLRAARIEIINWKLCLEYRFQFRLRFYAV